MLDGRVLIAGGRNFDNPKAPGAKVHDSAEIFDPETNTFTPTGSMHVARNMFMAVLLDDGRVLITGGGDSSGGGGSMAFDTAELYDPVTGTFKLLESKMSAARQYHNMVKLLDGTVLVVGGSQGPGLLNNNTKADRFDPETETFTYVGDTHAPIGCNACAAVLRDGRVLLSGSYDSSVSPSVVGNDADLFDPETNTFTKITGPAHGQTDILSVRLLDGTVMSPIGMNGKHQVSTATFLFQPDTNDFVFADSLSFQRTPAYPLLLKDGRPMIIGGYQIGKYATIAEIFTPSVDSQAIGLQNVIEDLPDSAFLLKLKVLKLFLSNRVQKVNQLIEQEDYTTARSVMATQVLPRIDGCSGAATYNDFVKDCDEQSNAYAPAQLLIKTLDEITGTLTPPVPAITADVVGTGTPLDVEFTGSATDDDGTISLYLWDFGDGENSEEQNPSHTYICPGDYTVLLTVVDNDGLLAQTTTNIEAPYMTGTTVSFSCEILPYYQTMCNMCHQGESPLAGLNLMSYEGVMAGSDNGPVVISGDPGNSKIVEVTGPPTNHPQNVGSITFDEEITAKQKAWILEGALNN
jgi:PKD repeat protein